MQAFSALIVGLCCAAGQVPPADLVLLDGKLVTVDAALPQAQALAVRGDRIVAVGSNDQVRPLIGPATQVIELGGKLAIPGFIEGHAHFLGVGNARMSLNLADAENWEEIIRRVARAAAGAPQGAWILGRGWHQGKWDRVPSPNVEGYPTHHALSQVSPENPVFLTHGTGHMSFANAKAMELAGVTRETPNPPGGEILRDAAGEPIGAFRETADELFDRALATDRRRMSAEEREREVIRQIELASEECLAKGVTSFQDAGSSLATAELFKRQAAEGKLGVRLWVMLNSPNRELAERLPQARLIGFAEGHLTVRAIKRLVDGALGTHGAWLLEPYADLPTSSGLNTTPLESIGRTAELAERHGFQLCVHAIGDRANREVLNLFQSRAENNPRFRELRWRIEHAQHIDNADIPRFAQLGVVASMQANHCTSDGPFVVQRLGAERAREGAYVWRKLIDSGAVVTNGTDAPVEDLSPLGSFYASVTRRMKDGRQFFPEHCLTRAEALKSYTLDAAYAAFEEDVKGSLTAGKLADIVVLSRDIMTVPEEELRQAEALYTIVGGKILYHKGEGR
jgi:predicted amidohydrolase YtcJ